MSLSQEMRDRILKRDDYTCAYCGHRPKYLAVRRCDRWQATLHVDHMFPVSKGGLDVETNLVTACATRNISKGPRLWPVPAAACYACGRWFTNLRYQPSLFQDGPVFECEGCERVRMAELAKEDELWEEKGEHSDLELEQRAWDAIEAQAWDVAA